MDSLGNTIKPQTDYSERNELLHFIGVSILSVIYNPHRAENYLFPPYPASNTFGYSTQTWLSRVVNEYLHPGVYYCWFARKFNSMANGDDSNPVWLYLIVDRAVFQNGQNNAKIKDLRTNLMRAVARGLYALGRADEVSSALAVIRSATIEMFTPQLWRIDLTKIRGRYSSGHQYPDEYLITNLSTNEFDVVVE